MAGDLTLGYARSRNFIFKGMQSALNAIGYVLGAGGAVTQLTSKSTAVTLNKATGQITLNNAALGAGANVVFIVNDSLVAINDVVAVSVQGGGTAYAYEAATVNVAAGSFAVMVRNITGGSLSEALIVNFAVLKGAAA